jgi:autotransporter-associated beta strand protein
VEKVSNLVGPVTLNGGTMKAWVPSANLNFSHYPYAYVSFQLGSNIVATGTSPSFIINNQPSFTTAQDGLSLQNGAVPTEFNVADITGDGDPDLTVSAALGDVNYDYTATSRSGGVLLKTGSGTILLSGLNYYSGGTRISAGTVVAGTADDQSLPAQGTFTGRAGAAGALGRPGTMITLGDANTAANNSSAALLIGGAFTVDHPVTVANQPTAGTYTIGGNVDTNATFTGAITVNQPLMISQVANTAGNALTLSGAITSAGGSQVVTFSGPGNVNVTTTAMADGGGQLGVNVTGGMLTLASGNTYSGDTTVAGGSLLVSGSLGSSAVAVGNGGVLGGAGTINGPVTIQDGGTLMPGGSLNTLTFGGSLTLLSNSTSIFEISKSPATNDAALVLGTVTYGGTLVVTNIGTAALAAGDSFTLFNAANFSGDFDNVALPELPAGLAWNTDALNTSGTLSVVATAPPSISLVCIPGNGLTFSGTGGVANADYYLIGTTNLTTPLSDWTRLLTNQFDNAGNFNFDFTNLPDAGSAGSFYRLQVP